MKDDHRATDQKLHLGQFFYAGNLIEYSGTEAPPDFTLPEGMEIIPWDHPRLFWLKCRGRLLAGPARREVLEIFVFQNQDHLLDLQRPKSFR